MNSAPRAGEPGAAGQGPERPRPGLLMGRPFGIPVYVSPSWFIVAGFITLWFAQQVPDSVAAPAGYAVAFAFAVLLYASVFVHELSHAVTARALGLPVRSVTLHILGGETAIERESPTPGREFLIAFAGPVVNLLLGVFGLVLLVLLPLPEVAELLLEALTFANLLVGVFNLLPGLPLDGGRLVRAAVWKATGRGRAGTVTAAWIGRGLAVLVLLGGAFSAATGGGGSGGGSGAGWVMLVWSALVASFIWAGATQAMRAERVRERIPRLDARRMARRATLVTADVPLAEAVRRARAESAGALVVVDGTGRPIGLVSERAVQATPEHRRPWIVSGDVSRGLAPELTLPADLAGEDLAAALRRAPASEYLLVERDGRVFGVLTAADVDRTFTGG